MKKKTAVVVLVDGENISHKKAPEINALTARLGSVAERKVYHRQKDPVTRPWTEKARRHAYRDICLAGAPEKNKVDKKIIKDARRSLKAPDVDMLCVVSSDSDFCCLAAEADSAGKKLCFIGGKNASKKLRNSGAKFMKLT